ncbi:endonuclease III [Rickettsia endosymbiont of Cardiosporidium cionae]|uniref:endonuclease III n=1 Tax=Rickettsia endosymbiont of Cardiosporidium cionae TaxID=2777155 RepID=UPI00189563B6|nr:endonuclease III [Rickettsia endosymbiont of Cardiosporidium cionae]KAF8818486.1 endonuclease III [Rickettsia endosymbiont of Cardiosporidium cionae]
MNFSNKINQIFQIFYNNNPNPKTELYFNNKFTLAIAVLLSAQSTDISVNKVTQNLFKEYNSPSKILQLGETKLKNYIKTIGLYNTKTKNIIALSEKLIEKYNSELPSEFTELISLPGIGRKSANVILSTAFNQNRIAVDTHVFRVSRRLGISSANNPHKVETDLVKLIDIKWIKNAHNWLVLHGRYVCKARNPLCPECCVNKYCKYFSEIKKVKSKQKTPSINNDI